MKSQLFRLFVTILALMPLMQGQSVNFHVTSYKYEYVGDKPTTQDCHHTPCTTAIRTAEGFTNNSNPNLVNHFVLRCTEWVLLGGASNAPQYGKCWVLKVGDYNATMEGAWMLFFDDTKETNPLYVIVEESEQPKDRSK